ncbi:FRG domain-containing protein [Thermomonas sp.]|uniref:FRG domain-containing protein n=1 Tax=Thermomonas sp. TaxID=1971895 RepID=UPI0035B1561A
MSTFTASSVIEFLGHIEDHGPEAMFRGQSDRAWPLLPSIARFADGLDGYDCISDLEEHLLERFRQFAVPFKDFRKLPIIEQLVHAQHYGLPTRLLDWSTNPLKALFFAIEETRLDSVDGAVYITRPSFWVEGTTHIRELKEFLACFPEVLHERIAAQDACLLVFPLSKDDMLVSELSATSLPNGLDFLHQIVIPAGAKRDLRRQLSVLGVTHRSVFPGLEGTTRWIKSDLSGFAA